MTIFPNHIFSNNRPDHLRKTLTWLDTFRRIQN